MGSLTLLDRRTLLAYAGGSALSAAGGLKLAAVQKQKAEELPLPRVSFIAARAPLPGYRPTKIPQAFRGRFDPEAVEWTTECRFRWDQKKRRYDNPVADRVGEQLVRELETMSDPRRVTLVEYQATADQIADHLHAQLDWTALPQLYADRRGRTMLPPDRAQLVRQVASHIDGHALIAYGLTEIRYSSTDGALNRDYVDFMLRYGGSEFVERIPAGSDRFTSYGLYQFTHWALYAHHRKRRGASIINEALLESERIPGSVAHLRGNDHFKAAYLFAIHNIVGLVMRLDERECATLEAVLPGRELPELGPIERIMRSVGLAETPARTQSPSAAALAVFIGAAHHLPAPSYTAGERWLKQKAVESFTSCISHGRVRKYASITAANYAAL